MWFLCAFRIASVKHFVINTLHAHGSLRWEKSEVLRKHKRRLFISCQKHRIGGKLLLPLRWHNMGKLNNFPVFPCILNLFFSPFLLATYFHNEKAIANIEQIEYYSRALNGTTIQCAMLFQRMSCLPKNTNKWFRSEFNSS